MVANHNIIWCSDHGIPQSHAVPRSSRNSIKSFPPGVKAEGTSKNNRARSCNVDCDDDADDDDDGNDDDVEANAADCLGGNAGSVVRTAAERMQRPEHVETTSTVQTRQHKIFEKWVLPIKRGH